MMRTRLALLAAVGVLAGVPTHAADEPKGSALTEKSADASDASSIDELSRKTSDPTASLMALNFQGIYSTFHGPDVPGEPDERWTLQFRPVIPFQTFGQPNILRFTVPYQIGGRGDEGWQPISVFDLVVFKQSWGRWGVGPVMSIDTTGDAPDSFAIGPAIGGVWQVSKKVNLGLFSQNVFWSDTGVSSLQPVLAYQLGKGWSVSAGDAQFTYDWKADRWVNVPLGFHLGKVTKIGKLLVKFAVNPQYNLIDDPGLTKWSVSLTFTTLFPSF